MLQKVSVKKKKYSDDISVMCAQTEMSWKTSQGSPAQSQSQVWLWVVWASWGVPTCWGGDGECMIFLSLILLLLEMALNPMKICF